MCVKCMAENNNFNKILYMNLLGIKLLLKEYCNADILSVSQLTELRTDANKVLMVIAPNKLHLEMKTSAVLSCYSGNV